MGREYALLTGRIRATEVPWPLSGDEIDERTDTARPKADGHASPLRTFNAKNTMIREPSQTGPSRLHIAVYDTGPACREDFSLAVFNEPDNRSILGLHRHAPIQQSRRPL